MRSMEVAYLRPGGSFMIGIKRVGAKYWALLCCGLGVGLVLLWSHTHRARPVGLDWLLVSRPVFERQKDSTGAISTISVCVSNMGPRAIQFRVGWFECRAKRDRALLATNEFDPIKIPISLSSGASTKITLGSFHTDLPAGEPLCCCMMDWTECESISSKINWLVAWLNISPFETDALQSGLAFTANTEVGDYFRSMYGFKPLKPNEGAAQEQPATATATYMAVSMPSTAEEQARDAFLLYSLFCQKLTNFPPEAEPGDPQNPAPAYR
jgi:hypothetical protein